MTPRTPRYPHQHKHVAPFGTLSAWKTVVLGVVCAGVGILALWLFVLTT
jgi:hypothetical protein